MAGRLDCLDSDLQWMVLDQMRPDLGRVAASCRALYRLANQLDKVSFSPHVIVEKRCARWRAALCRMGPVDDGYCRCDVPEGETSWLDGGHLITQIHMMKEHGVLRIVNREWSAAVAALARQTIDCSVSLQAKTWGDPDIVSGPAAALGGFLAFFWWDDGERIHEVIET